MAEAESQQSPSRNSLLGALPHDEFELLRPKLERVHLDLKEVLYEPDQPISHVYFIETGVTSLVSVMSETSLVEIATIGNEGMVGLPVYLGAVSIPQLAFCQVAGDAQRMDAEAFREYMAGVGERTLHRLLHLYTQALFNQIARSAACNRAHSIRQRAARWLLQTRDRMGSDDIQLTQEFLAQMLGVRRASVSEVAGNLQKEGLIHYVHGKISIVDRPGLEAVVCDCYRVVSDEYERLLGSVPPEGRR
jgi:CRP-like cAMP-binding protein